MARAGAAMCTLRRGRKGQVGAARRGAARRRRRSSGEGTISGAAGRRHPLVNNARWRAGEAPVPDSTARNS